MGILDASRRSGEAYVRSPWDWLYEPVDQLIRFSKAALVIFMILGVMHIIKMGWRFETYGKQIKHSFNKCVLACKLFVFFDTTINRYICIRQSFIAHPVHQVASIILLYSQVVLIL